MQKEMEDYGKNKCPTSDFSLLSLTLCTFIFPWATINNGTLTSKYYFQTFFAFSSLAEILKIKRECKTSVQSKLSIKTVILPLI